MPLFDLFCDLADVVPTDYLRLTSLVYLRLSLGCFDADVLILLHDGHSDVTSSLCVGDHFLAFRNVLLSAARILNGSCIHIRRLGSGERGNAGVYGMPQLFD
jgi:hypothetical protein